MSRGLKYFIGVILLSSILVGILLLTLNLYVQKEAEEYILKYEDVPNVDAILVLGAYVFPDGSVSLMLNDRLTVAKDLYELGKSNRLIVSGDHGRNEYDEVNTMKSFLVKKGIPSEHIFMDHAGFSTYESIYRARDIFKAKKVIIVTQEYHLKRAVFIARELGLEAYGVPSDQHNYGNVMYRYELREIAARNKDFFLAKWIKPEPTYLGEDIPVSGNGNLTNDK